jgi:hypothetical protein
VQKHTQGSDWWWQLRFGMCYYKLGLFQEAIRQHEKSLELCNMDETVLHLNKCYLRIDQPLIAAKMFSQLADKHPGTTNRFSLHLLCVPVHGAIICRSVCHVWKPPRMGRLDDFMHPGNIVLRRLPTNTVAAVVDSKAKMPTTTEIVALTGSEAGHQVSICTTVVPIPGSTAEPKVKAATCTTHAMRNLVL